MRKLHLVILLFGALFSTGFACAEDAVVVANKAVKASEISSEDLHDIFTGSKSSLKDGSHVVPVTLKGGTVHDTFLKKYVGKTDAAFRTEWRSLVFTGQAAMPKTFDSDAALVDYVAATPGAIGYVAKGGESDKVKVLSIK